jgi:hypothetical protein
MDVPIAVGMRAIRVLDAELGVKTVVGTRVLGGVKAIVGLDVLTDARLVVRLRAQDVQIIALQNVLEGVQTRVLGVLDVQIVQVVLAVLVVAGDVMDAADAPTVMD